MHKLVLRSRRSSNSLEVQVSTIRQTGIYRDLFNGKTGKRPKLDGLMKVIDYGDKPAIARYDNIAH